MSEPITTFLIPSYNDTSEAITKTISSVTNQTVPCKILIVDDGSSKPITLPQSRHLEVLRLERNVGITQALHLGVQKILTDSSTRYIARLDIGDTNRPTRIEHQEKFMDVNPDVDLVGCRSVIVRPDGTEVGTFGVVGQPEIDNYLFQNSPFRHSTFLIRVESIRKLGNYDNGLPLAQDYELLMRYARRGKINSLQDALIEYEDSPGGLTRMKRRRQLMMRLKIQYLHRNMANPRWYIGVFRTLATMIIPKKIIEALAPYKA